mmetsp:Transcript_18427/g.27327  ORF Transcript_18427/g.27327 Transcript_18427/m.27327 type:complete len:285 (-) Transcript_18427:1805-2659(-)
MAYDLEYLESGCTLNYDPATNFDGAAWGYITDYIIWVLGIIFTIALFVKQGFSPNKGFVPFYFLLSTTAYGVGGIIHQLVERKDDPAFEPLWTLSHTFAILGYASLLAVAISYAFPGKKFRIYGCLVLGVALSLIAEFTDTGSMVAQIVGLTVQLMMGIFWSKDAIRQKTDSASPGVYWASIWKVMSVAFQVVGASLYLAGRVSCVYEDCFENCFFPNPFVFNQNAVFHFGLIMSYALLGIAEIFDPTLLKLNAPAEEGANSDFVENVKAQGGDDDDYEDDANC